MKYSRLIKSLFFFIADTVFLKITLLKERNRTVKKDTAIIKVDGIGDFFMFTWFLKNLKNNNPNKICLICSSHVGKVAASLDYVDSVIPIDVNKLKYNLLYRIQIIRKIRRQEFKMVLNPTYSNFFLTGHSLARFAISANKICLKGDNLNSFRIEQSIAYRWYDNLFYYNFHKLSELKISHFLLEKLNCKNIQKFQSTVPNKLTLNPIKVKPKKYCVIFPGASDSYRTWKMENFILIINWLYQNYGIISVLCGSSLELKRISKYKKEIQKTSSINLIGKTSIIELVEVIRDCSLLISNDSSAVHIAASVNSKSLCILGGGQFGRFLPYEDGFLNSSPTTIYKKLNCFNCDWNCYKKNQNEESYPCLNEITPNQVKGKINDLLNNSLALSFYLIFYITLF